MDESRNITLNLGVKIALRDGLSLNATVYLPRDQPDPGPCLCAMTPYNSDVFHDHAAYFAAHGLPFVLVDVRGRGDSDGVFRPFIQEGADGYEVVEWLAAQPYCNGNVAMWGSSYLGHNQWAVAAAKPPHLVTIVPTASPYIGIDFPMRNRIFYPHAIQWLSLTHGRSTRVRLFGDRSLWSQVSLRWGRSGRPFQDFDAVLGTRFPFFREWIVNRESDCYWSAHNPTADQYAQMQMPILTVTGYYDDDQPGALAHYIHHLRNASPAARQQHYLIVGPWDHAGTVTPRAEFGGLKAGAASVIDMLKLHLEWYTWIMKGGSKPAFLKRRVAYYLLGAERWRYADSLDDVTARHHPYYVCSNGNADDVFSGGSLQDVQASGPPDVYVYDPRACDGADTEAEARADGESLVDQSIVLALQGKALVYHSPPFSTDVEVAGFFRLTAYISIDCPDTDFYVSVHEICLDGESIRLTTDAMRARYRNGAVTPQLVRDETPLCYEFNRFTFIARRISRGHRLRLVLAPIGRLMAATFWEKNYNGGGDVAAESSKDGRPVTVRLFHDETYPSVLHVPIGRVDP